MISLITTTPEYIEGELAERARRDAEGLAGVAKNLPSAVALSGLLVGGVAIADRFTSHRPPASISHISPVIYWRTGI